MAEIVDKLKNYRARHKLSQKELAKRLGISPRTVERWFCVGKSHGGPSEENMLKIERYLESVGYSGMEKLANQFDIFQSKEGVDNMKHSQYTSLHTPKIDLSPFKTFPLALRGDVKLNKLETEIVQTEDFRRLAGLKQLGTTYLVYPSATHTRFEHSIGTLGWTDLLIQKIRENPQNADDEKTIPLEDTALARLLALLHDVTHVPFGHTLESEAGILKNHEQDDERIERFLGRDSPIGRIILRELGNDLCNLLMRLIKTSHKDVETLSEHAYIADIVKNTLCADLLDYMERDSWHCTLQLGFARRFLNYLYIAPVDRSRRLVVRLWKEREQRHRIDLANELVDMLQARFSLGQAVYYHHAKCISSAMISRAVWSAMNAARPDKLSLKQLWTMSDNELLSYLTNFEDPVLQKLASQLKKRWLFKRSGFVVRREEAESVAAPTDWLAYLREHYYENPKLRAKEEDNLAELSGYEPGDVLIYCPHPDMSLKSAETLVLWKGEPRPLYEIDMTDIRDRISLLDNLHKNLWTFQVFVNPHYEPEKSTEAKLDSRVRKLKALCQDRFSAAPQVEDAGIRLVVTEIVNQLGFPQIVDEVLQRTGTMRGDRTLGLSELKNVALEIAKERGLAQ